MWAICMTRLALLTSVRFGLPKALIFGLHASGYDCGRISREPNCQNLPEELAAFAICRLTPWGAPLDPVKGF